MTKSLCPICFKPLDAEVFDEDGKILIKKTCDEHGEFVNTYWSDDKLYNREMCIRDRSRLRQP